MTISADHRRFLQQAGWTASLRAHLLSRAHWENAHAVLEVGCGTGAILQGLAAAGTKLVAGVDINPARLAEARQAASRASLICADGLQLPFADRSFDLAVCHFYLLWVSDALLALQEMRRVTRPGGMVLALAEPDYTHRIDLPAGLERLGALQTRALRAQGADPGVGARLPSLFMRAGLRKVFSGLVGGEWTAGTVPDGWQEEWETLERDLKDCLPDEELKLLKKQDERAWQKGERVLYVPTFYAGGVV